MKYLYILASLTLSSATAQAGISFAAPAPYNTFSGGSYTAGDIVTISGDTTTSVGTNWGPSMGRYEGIEFDFSSSIDGTFSGLSFFPYFQTTSVITADTAVKFTFDGNMQLGSLGGADGGVADGQFTSSRAAFSFGVREAPGAAGTLDVMSSGGVSSLASYIAGASGSTFALSNAGSNANATPTSTSGDNASFGTITLPSSSNPYVLEFTDPDYTSGGYTYEDIMLTFTPSADLPVGTQFRFTFEGVNRDAQLAAIAIPEPSRALLTCLAGVALISRRSRKLK